MTNRARTRLGFTLAEMAAVLVVVLVLAAVAVPTYRAVIGEVRQDAVTASAKALRNHIDALAAEEQVPSEVYDITVELGLYNEDPEKITAAEYGTGEVLVTGTYGSDSYYACITLSEQVGGTSSVADGHCDDVGSLNTQLITFDQPPNVMLSEGSRVLEASSSVGLVIAFTSSTPSVCSISGSTAVLHALGVCTVTASQAGGDTGDGSFAPAPPVTRSFTVLTGIGEPFPLTATPGNAEATLSFDSIEGAASYTGRCWTEELGEDDARSGTTSATASGTEVILVENLENLVVHTCKVYADVGAYSVIADVMPAAVVGGDCPDVELGFDPDTCTPGLEPPLDPLCPDGPSTEIIEGCGATEEIRTDYTQQITFYQPDDQPLTAEWVTVVAASSSGLPVELESNTTSVCTVSNATVLLLASGTCRLTAYQDGGTVDGITYTTAPPVSRAFQIYGEWVPIPPGDGSWGPSNPLQVIYFPAPADRMVGGLPFDSGAVASSGLTVTLSSSTTPVCSTTGLSVAVHAVGVCVLTASQAGGTVDGVTYEAATPVVRQFQVLASGVDGGGAGSSNILDVTNHFAHDGAGPHHIFFGLQNRFGFTRDHSSLGPNYLFTAFPLNTSSDGSATVSFANPSALAYGRHPAREDNVPGTNVSAIYLADPVSGKIHMAVWNAERAYEIAHGFNEPSGVSWSACVDPSTGAKVTIGNTTDCLYVADDDGIWMTPLEYRCTSSCDVGYRQPATSISRSNTSVVEIVDTAAQRVFAASSSLWVSTPDRLVEYSYQGQQLRSVTGVAPYGVVHVPGRGVYFTDLIDHTIKHFDVTTGVVSTLAGSGLAAFGDGIAAQASFRSPHGITFHGNVPFLYIADTGNNAVRRVNWETGEVVTILRPGTVVNTDPGALPAAVSGDGINNLGTDPISVTNLDWYGSSLLDLPGLKAVARDGADLYLLSSTSGLYRYSLTSGTTTQLIAWVDQTVSGGAVVADGNLYYAKASSIERINLSTLVRTGFAGVSSNYGSTDGVGSAARFAGYIQDVTTDGTYLYATTTSGCTKCVSAVRKIRLDTAEVTTLLTRLPAEIDGGYGSGWDPTGLVLLGGQLYVGTDVGVVTIDPTTAAAEVVSTLRGMDRLTGNSTHLYGGGGAGVFRIDRTDGAYDAVTVSGTGLGFNVGTRNPDPVEYGGDLYVADTGNNRLVRLSEEPHTTTSDPASTAARFAITDAYGAVVTDGIDRPNAAAFYGGYLYVLSVADGIYRVDPGTGAQTIVYPWTDHTVNGGAVVVGDNLYYSSGSAIYRVDLVTLRRDLYAGTTSSYGTTDGLGTSARFNGLVGGLTTDGTYLYVADSGSAGSVHRCSAIRKIDLATTEVTTLVRTLPGDLDRCVWRPDGVAWTGGQLYVAAASAVFKIDPDSGSATLLAGAVNSSGQVDGDATTARFSNLNAAVADADHLYVAQNNHIRRVNLETGYTRTIASGSGSGVGEDTQLGSPLHMTSDGSTLLVADSDGDRVIRFTQTPFTSIADSGTQTTQIGVDSSATGSTVGSGLTGLSSVTAANGELYYLATGSGIHRLDGSLVLSWSDQTLNGGATSDGRAVFYTRGHAVYRFDLRDGTVALLAGSSEAGYSDGVAGSARFSSPTGLTTDGTYLYVADTGNDAVRRVDLSSGSTTTLLRSWSNIRDPRAITYSAGSVFVGAGARIVRIDVSTGVWDVLSGLLTVGNVDGDATATRFGTVFGLTTDGTYLYATDSLYHTVRRITIADGSTITVAGDGTSGSTLGSSTRFSSPRDLAVLGGALYVADSGNGRVVRLGS